MPSRRSRRQANRKLKRHVKRTQVLSGIERLESRTMLDGSGDLFSHWRHPLFPSDINDDGSFSARDLLTSAQSFLRFGTRQVSQLDGLSDNFLDYNGDNWFSPRDVLGLSHQFLAAGFQSFGIDFGPRASLQSVADVTAATGEANTAVVKYHDFPAGLNLSSIDATDLIAIRMTPGRLEMAPAQAQVLSTGLFHFSVTAGYDFVPEDQQWDAADNGSYRIYLRPHAVRDRVGHYAQPVRLGQFQVDINDPPELAAIPPQDITLGETVSFTAQATDPNANDTLTYSLTGDVPAGAAIDPDTGQFTWTPDETGQFQVTVEVSDDDGATDQETVTVDVMDDFPAALTLGEGENFLVDGETLIDLGQQAGTRRLSFEVRARFDASDPSAAVEDTFLVSLVDPSDPSTTLLDRGTAGTALFMLAGEQIDYIPGLVTFDGSTLEIDVTQLGNLTQGQLLFQLINSDTDNGSQVAISQVRNVVDPEDSQGPSLNPQIARSAIGGPLDLTGLSPASQVDTEVTNVRFDPATGQYTADVTLVNSGSSLSRNTVVLLPGLPTDVTVLNASGTDANGVPYLNLQPALPGGGLAAGESSATVTLQIANPNLSRFSLLPTVLTSGPNTAPTLAAIAPVDVMVGEYLEIPLNATDADGDPLRFSLIGGPNLPTGMLSREGSLILTPAPGEEGNYTFTLEVSDGQLSTRQQVTVNVVPDPVTTTRVFGVIEDVNQQPLAGIPVSIGDLEAITAADGSFFIETGNPLPSDTLLVKAQLIPGNYPFIAEKLPLVLNHPIYPNAKNEIARPIYLPQIDVANAMPIDPAQDTTVTTAAIPGASVLVRAGTLLDQQGQQFTGQLSITEVPPALTPAALPPNLRPDLVVTIQPGEMVFTQPAPLNFPNSPGYDPGTLLDLWSINPVTGVFDDVGDMRVSPDGSVIETISGGVRNSSWHFPAPPPENPNNDDDGNEDDDCDECKATGAGPSRIELHSGAYLEDHALVSYQSLGQTRGLGLHYDSQRANPQPIVFFGFDNVNPGANRRIVASVEVQQGNFTYQVPGYSGDEFGLQGGEHIWTIPSTAGPVRGSLQLDLQNLPTGVYDYNLTTGVMNFDGQTFAGTTSTSRKQLRLVNYQASPFGAGWGLSGLQQIHENPDGSVLLVDGDGSELYFFPTEGPGSYISPPGDFSALVKLGDGTFQRTTPSQTVYRFDAGGRIASMTDRNNNQTGYQYDASGIIQRMIDPVGLETVFTAQGGRITAITDPANRVTQLEYDTDGNLIKVTDPDGSFRTWDYDRGHRIVQEIDKLGRVEQTQYNVAGRVIHTVLSDGTDTMYDPLQTQYLKPFAATTDPLNAPQIDRLVPISAAYSDSNGNVTEVMLDKQGQAVNQRDGEGSLGNVFRNVENLIQTSGDSRGFSTDFTYDSQGNVTSITDRVGALTGGSLFVTGHDSDDHANGGYQRAGLDFLTFGRAASSQAEIDLRDQVSIAFLGNRDATNRGAAASGYTNRTFIDLDNANWADTAFSGSFEILIIGTGGDYVTSAGSAALNAEASRFADYFNTGGGIYVNTDQGSIGQSFYNFLPTFGATQAAVGGTGVYTVTPEGSLIGLTEPIVDADPTHTEYKNVDTSIFRVFETHNQTGDAVAIGLFQGFIGGGFGGVARQFFTYDPNFSQPTSYEDGQGRRFVYAIDPATGNRTSSTRVVGQLDDPTNGESDDLTTLMAYTSAGQLDSMTDPLGRVTDFSYDSQGRLVTVVYAQGTADEATFAYEYDLAGNQTAMIDGNGNRTEYTYDSLNRLIRTIEPDPDGSGPLTSPVTTMVYDSRGNVVSMTDPQGNTTTSVFDDKDRLIRSTGPDPDGAGPLPSPVTRYRYDLTGNLASVTDPNGNTTRYAYDSRNRRITMTDPDGGVTRFGYDPDDNLSIVIDPVGNSTRFTYDARNRLVEEIDPLGAKISYSYDASNNLISKTDRNGRETRYEYDSLNRLTLEEWVDSNDTVINAISYVYDAASNLLSVGDSFSALSYTYDARDRVASVDNTGTPGAPDVVLAYSYDANGNVLGVTDTIDGAAGATTAYAYDGLNRLLQLTQAGANTSDKRVDFSYNAIGQYTSIDRYSDLAGTQLVIGTSYSYDSQNRLTRLDHQNSSGASVAFYDYVYDTASRITQIADIDGVRTYSYDDRDQLTAANYTDPNQTDEAYQYDANGNRVSSSQHGSGYVTGQANRLMSDGTYDYQYDAEGNMTRRTEIATGNYRVFVWDHRNRLVAVNDFLADDTPTQTVNFSYDALNRRVSKGVDTDPTDAVDQVLTHFVYDREDVVLDFVDAASSSSAKSIRYLHGPGADFVVAQYDDSVGESRWLLGDHLQSTRQFVDNVGAVLSEVKYDANGTPFITGVGNSRFLYTGREYDPELALAHYRSRYLDTVVGRFLSEDLLKFRSGDANHYRYVNNSPVASVDPTGASAVTFWELLGIAGGFSAADGPLPIGELIGGGILVIGGIYIWMNADGTIETSDVSDVGDSSIADTDQPGGRDPCRGLERQLRFHEQKLREFVRNPDAFDNKGFLEQCTDPALRDKIIQGRIRNLQRQIENFRRQLDACRKANPR